uniref:Uncharacterized protein n=1 Tax=Anguilla anguilla TaxID=7936 RepID=A0A0E9Q5G4_ANGAN
MEVHPILKVPIVCNNNNIYTEGRTR